MPSIELLKLMRNATAAQLLEREDFAKRWEANEPISLLEMLYPPLQGYDSVAIEADVELGGTDQKFNLLFGRDIQRAYGRPQQAILTMPILVGVDGSRKMSKSLGNQIGIADSPGDVYGKTMSIPDEAMGAYYRLLLGSEPSTPVVPRDAKRELARELVAWLHSPAAATAAEQGFERMFVAHEAPEEIEEARFRAEDGSVHLPEVIAEAFGVSRSEARRLVDQGGVVLGEQPLRDGEYDVAVERADGQVLRVGRRRFRRLRADDGLQG
jgi:tyrosyl-tRNA synthetase